VRSIFTAAVAAAALLAFGGAAAQGYPSRPIHFVVPFTAGSGADIIARAIGDVMARDMGQSIIVDNRPGAGGTIAAAQVAKAEPDGYTVLIHSSGHALNPSLHLNLPYDTLKDLTGVTPLAALPNVMVVSPSRGWKSVADVVAAAKARPASAARPISTPRNSSSRPASTPSTFHSRERPKR
jgi:tripartite-type tricarboxylate transporter receptor subunit TctC